AEQLLGEQGEPPEDVGRVAGLEVVRLDPLGEHGAAEVDEPGPEVARRDLQPQRGERPAGRGQGVAGLPRPTTWRGSSRSTPPARRVSTRRETVERVSPLAAASAARDTGSGEAKAREATTERFRSRNEAWPTPWLP